MTWVIWGSLHMETSIWLGAAKTTNEDLNMLLPSWSERTPEYKKSNDHGLRRSKNKTTQHFLLCIEHVCVCVLLFFLPIDPENCSKDYIHFAILAVQGFAGHKVLPVSNDCSENSKTPCTIKPRTTINISDQSDTPTSIKWDDTRPGYD